MKASKIEFEIGKDSYQRRVTIVIESNFQGKEVVHITSHAASQRGDTIIIANLTKSNIIKMAEAVSLIK